MYKKANIIMVIFFSLTILISNGGTSAANTEEFWETNSLNQRAFEFRAKEIIKIEKIVNFWVSRVEYYKGGEKLEPIRYFQNQISFLYGGNKELYYSMADIPAAQEHLIQTLKRDTADDLLIISGAFTSLVGAMIFNPYISLPRSFIILPVIPAIVALVFTIETWNTENVDSVELYNRLLKESLDLDEVDLQEFEELEEIAKVFEELETAGYRSWSIIR